MRHEVLIRPGIQDSGVAAGIPNLEATQSCKIWCVPSLNSCKNRIIHNKEVDMSDNHTEMLETGDSKADAFAAVVLVAVFVATCIFWVAGQ